MKSLSLNNIKIIVLASFLTVTTAEMTVSNYLLIKSPYNAFLIPFFFLGILLIVSLFLPSFKESIIKDVLKNVFIRIVLIIYLFISFYIFYLSTLIVISEWFYIKTPTILIVLTISFGINILSMCSPNKLINIGFYMAIICSVIGLIKYLSINQDLKFMINSLEYRFDKPYELFLTIYLFFNSILFYLITLNNKPAINKKSFQITSIITIIFTLSRILEVYLYFVPKAIPLITYPALYTYKLYPGNKFFENSSLLLLINAITSILFTGSINLYLLRILLKFKHSMGYFLGQLVFVTISVNILFSLDLLTLPAIFYINIVMTILISIFIFYLFILKRRYKLLSKN